MNLDNDERSKILYRILTEGKRKKFIAIIIIALICLVGIVFILSHKEYFK